MPKTLEEVVAGKRVCIVGPAGYLEQMDYGNLIDLYDVVIRINKLFFIIDEKSASYTGRKTDVVYSTGWPPDMMTKLFLENKQKLSTVLFQPIPAYRDSLREEELFKRYAINLLGRERVLDTSAQSNAFLKHYDQFAFHLNTGMMCILHTISAKPDQLFITGMDFLSGKNRYTKGYDDKVRQKYGIGGHNPYKDPALLKKVLENTKVSVILDPVMHRIVYK